MSFKDTSINMHYAIMLLGAEGPFTGAMVASMVPEAKRKDGVRSSSSSWSTVHNLWKAHVLYRYEENGIWWYEVPRHVLKMGTDKGADYLKDMESSTWRRKKETA